MAARLNPNAMTMRGSILRISAPASGPPMNMAMPPTLMIWPICSEL
jgi:hypothetical protein